MLNSFNSCNSSDYKTSFYKCKKSNKDKVNLYLLRSEDLCQNSFLAPKWQTLSKYHEREGKGYCVLGTLPENSGHTEMTFVQNERIL